MKRILLVVLSCLFLSSSAFALTIYTNAHGVIRDMQGPYYDYPYFFDDTKWASSGTISSYVNQNSPDVFSGWPPDLEYPGPLDTSGISGSACATASVDGFLSVSAQCEKEGAIDKLKFSAEASWYETIINNDLYDKNYVLNMCISHVNFYRSWWGEASIESLSYGVDVLLNGSLIWNTSYTISDDMGNYGGGSESILIPACNLYIPLGAFSMGESFDLRYTAKAYALMYDSCEIATYVGPFTLMGQVSSSPVPEPTSMFMLGVGLLSLVGLRKKITGLRDPQ